MLGVVCATEQPGKLQFVTVCVVVPGVGLVTGGTLGKVSAASNFCTGCSSTTQPLLQYVTASEFVELQFPTFVSVHGDQAIPPMSFADLSSIFPFDPMSPSVLCEFVSAL